MEDCLAGYFLFQVEFGRMTRMTGLLLFSLIGSCVGIGQGGCVGFCGHNSVE